MRLSTLLQPRRRVDHDDLWYALLGVWLTAMLVGGGCLWRTKLTPAAIVHDLPEAWPAASAIARADGVATLVMLAHPRCPCTRASIAELARLMTDAYGHVQAHVLVVRPPGAPEQWERTGLWPSAAAIPGVTVHVDIDGHEARRFGATASGHVVVYDAAGRLRFRGGITAARGHEGDNPGRSQALAAILHSLGDASTPTFGCELLTADASASSGAARPDAVTGTPMRTP